ncbi:sigma factor [Streptomyces formicae]
MSTETISAEEFASHRPRVFGLAYRMLGSAQEAEDTVQDAYLRWHGARRMDIERPAAWLAKTVTHLCLNRLTSARARREEYVGTWLPEPVITSGGALGPLESAELPLMPVLAGVGDQPIEVSEVAGQLAELAVADPAGRVPDMGGPEIHTFTDLARTYLRATGKRRALLPVRLPGKTFRAARSGGHLSPERAVGRGTFEEFLTRKSGNRR